MKKIISFRISLLLMQETWLNKMASKGYRLNKVGTFLCTFEKCSPKKYQYCTEFVAPKSFKDIQEYVTFLNELGYRTLTKSINLNYCIFKIRWRPYGQKFGQIATKPGTYGKEILIVERENTNQPFILHSTYHDKVNYYKSIRNSWLSIFILYFFISIWYTFTYATNLEKNVCIIVLLIILFLPILFYQNTINQYNKHADMEE